MYEVGNAERRKLEARLVTLVQQSEDASLSAAAEAESLRKALGESKEEVHAVSEQQHQYQAEAEASSRERLVSSRCRVVMLLLSLA